MEADPLAALGQLVSETGQQHATATLATMTLTEALSAGIGATREAITAGLDADERLRDTGVAIVGVRVLAIKPEAEMERALQTPTRESVQQAADRATYERRALAVESERAISENELQSKIELATREKDLLAQEGANARTRAEDAAAAQGIADDAAARGERVLGEARAAGSKGPGRRLQRRRRFGAARSCGRDCRREHRLRAARSPSRPTCLLSSWAALAAVRHNPWPSPPGWSSSTAAASSPNSPSVTRRAARSSSS